MSQPINSASQIRIILVLVAAYVIWSFADTVRSQSPALVPPSESSIKRQLVRVSNELNKGLPRTLSPYMRLDQISPGVGKTLEYRYTLLKLVKQPGLDLSAAIRLIRPMLVDRYKSDASLDVVRKSGVVMNHRFFDKNGIYLADFLIGPNDLK